jgi:imidazolonepropionase
MKLLIRDIQDLITWNPLVQENRNTSISMNDLGRLTNGWLAVDAGKVADYGTGDPPELYASWPSHSAQGGLVIPGMVDSHTHAIFGGERSQEFVQRLNGATYQEIAASGGGIASSRKSTREASDEILITSLKKHLSNMGALGITSVEVKSGYGLNVESETRLLKLLKKFQAQAPITMRTTCLALHAPSPEHDSLKSYVEACCQELLPRVKEEGLADYVDAFIEEGYFSVQDVEPYAQKAIELGLGIRLHADEFSDAGAAAAAAAWGAVSADHLQFASDSGIKAMAKAGVVATILPGTSLFTNIPYTNGRRLADHGCAVAVATDFNPGSSYIDNLPMLAVISSLHGGLRPAESLAAVTRIPALSLGLTKKGALAKGFDADLVIYEDLPNLEAWFYDFGKTRPSTVMVAGLVADFSH